jgi:hypothetical protein
VDLSEFELTSGVELPGVDPRLVHSVGQYNGRVFALLDVPGLLAPALG